jgi:hypothetical protein
VASTDFLRRQGWVTDWQWQGYAGGIRAAAHSIADAPELLGPHDRQRPQHHLLHQRENHRGRPDAESEGEDGYGGETGGQLSGFHGGISSGNQALTRCAFSDTNPTDETSGRGVSRSRLEDVQWRNTE